MARRDLSTYRQVTEQIASAPDSIKAQAAQTGQRIILDSEQAKVAKATSAAQLEINDLTAKYQVKWGDDPNSETGLEEFKSDRQAILDKYGSNISPLVRNQWDATGRQLLERSDLGYQAWQLKQSMVNTKRFIEGAHDDYLQQAYLSGQAYANNPTDMSETLLAAETARSEMAKAVEGKVSAGEFEHQMRKFDGQYIKSMISGVAETNPVMALTLADSDMVKEKLDGDAEFVKFKDAIENRAIQFREIDTRREILGALKSENELFMSGRKLSYAELDRVTSNMSEDARKYFFKQYGYSSNGESGQPSVKLDKTQQALYKGELVNSIRDLSMQEEVKIEDVMDLQDAVYKGINNGSLSEKEAMTMVTSMLNPLIESRGQEVEALSSNPFFSENVGFDGLESYYDSNVRISGEDEDDPDSGLGATSLALNAANKAQMYEFYLSSLDEEINKRGLTIADLPNLEDNYEVYKKAQDSAIAKFRSKASPALTLMPFIPIEHIVMLNKNPALSPQFDEQYGPGASIRVLGQ